MAEYYVSKSGSDTAPYDTWEKAASTIKRVIDYIANNGSPGNTVGIAAGEYTHADDYFSLTNANLASTNFIGEGKEKTLIKNSSVTSVIFLGTDADNVSFTEMSAEQTASSHRLIYSQAGNSGAALSDMQLVGPDEPSDYALRLYGDDISFDRVEFKTDGMGTYPLARVYSGDADFNYCISRAKDGALFGNGGIYNYSSGIVNINNSLLLDIAKTGVLAVAGTTNIRNSIVQAGINNKSNYCVYNNGGTINAYNNIWFPSLYSGTATSGLTIDSDNQIGVVPKFVSKSRGGYLIPWVDDQSGIDYAVSLGELLDGYNSNGVYSPALFGLTSGDWQKMQTMVSSGKMQVSVHTYSHPHLSYEHGIAVTYTGSDNNPTVAVTSTEIQLRTTEGNDNLTLNRLTDTDFGSIIAHNGENHWGLAYSTTDGQTGFNSPTYTSSLVSSMTATAVPCDIELDRSGISSGFFKNEIADVKTSMESNIGSITDGQTSSLYECNTFVAPYGDGDAEVEAAVKAAGYDVFRWASEAETEDCQQFMARCDTYKMFSLNMQMHLGHGQTEAEIRQLARIVGFAVAHTGIICGALAHDETEFTLTEWGYVIDEWSKIEGLSVTSMQLVIQDLKDSWEDDGNGVYTKEFTDAPNYHIKSQSPCRDAGIEIAGVTDGFYGSAPDIGAYEYRPSRHSGLSLGLNLGL